MALACTGLKRVGLGLFDIGDGGGVMQLAGEWRENSVSYLTSMPISVNRSHWDEMQVL